MPLTYRLVQRPDMHKDADKDAKLYYAQVRSQQKLSFEKLCDMIAVRSTAFTGDVMLVIEGLLSVMEERLTEGDIVRLGRLGNFRIVAGSQGTETEKDFSVALFNKPRIVFSPGNMLNSMKGKVKFEKATVVEKECDRPHAV
ncbi:HU family DNA-binding protein [Parabacteroides bouchesdurhonensis]|uniref:HU family DNA-binding protein n=1 Tax=Parabacteroides bouchesdurhonensis TaxID=1936995 RepID=UPI000C838044|nr:HU family DNA-binding protein [Parabacteroides bouchesdurhonensis]